MIEWGTNGFGHEDPNGISINESLRKTIALEQRALADGGTLVDRNNTVNSIPYTLLKLNPSLVIGADAFKESVLYGIIPNNSTGDFSYTQNTANGTIINQNGEIEIVPANTPRITWVNGKPEILVEPTSTNLIEKSEDYSGSYWSKINATITPNDTPSIIKNELADRVVQNTGTTGRIALDLPVTNDSVTRCMSVYVKKETTNKFAIFFMRFSGGSSLIGTNIQINKKTGAYYTNLTGAGGGFTTPINAGVISEGDYWRVYMSINNNSTGNTDLDLNITPNRGVALNDFTQDDGDAVIAGVQVEEGDMPTALIPTNGAIATRNDDVATVTPPAGTTEIREYLPNGTYNSITTIPATYQIPNGRWQKIIML